MLPRLCSAAVLVGLALAAFAQPEYPGRTFPIAGTRYVTTWGNDPCLVSNGRDPVVFWTAGGTLRVSRYVNGRFLMSRGLAEVGGFDDTYDVVWTGTHFLVVFGTDEGIKSLVLDAAGEPRGKPLLIQQGVWPRIAWNGRHVLMLFIGQDITSELHALLLSAEGSPAEAGSRPLGIEPPQARVALASNGDSFAALVPNAFDPLFLFFDAGGRLQSRSVFASHGAGVAIASDGRRYLGVAACDEMHLCMPAVSRLIGPDGTAAPPVELDQPFHSNPTVVWGGTKWVVAYVRDIYKPDEAALQIVHLDASARAVERREERPAALQASLGFAGGRVLAAWVNDLYGGDVVNVGPLPLDPATSVPASFAAAGQGLSGVAASAHGTLAVWQEGGITAPVALYTGFRALDGTWTERQIRAGEEGAQSLVASDGQQFMLYTAAGREGPLVRRLDRDGAPVGQPVAVPFFVNRMLWSGRDYLLFYGGGRAVARMSADGTLTATRELPAVTGYSPVFAAGGDGGLIFVRIEQTYVDHYPRILALSVVRLDRNLEPIDTTPVRLPADPQAIGMYGAGWDGRQYVVTWVSRDRILASHIPASGPVEPKEMKVADGRADQFFIEPVPGGAAIQWNRYSGRNHLTFLRHDGTTGGTVTLNEGTDLGLTNGQIAPLANGDLAYVESTLLEGAPFERTRHLTFRVFSNAPLPPRPSAPRLTAGETLLTWDAPPQPVDGFRLEARIDDGPWIEIAPPLPRDARSFTFQRQPGSSYAFRIRAWNEAGMGAYSGDMPRRRAVR